LRSRVYETVELLSVRPPARLSVPSIDSSSSVWRFAAERVADRKYLSTAGDGAQQQMRAVSRRHRRDEAGRRLVCVGAGTPLAELFRSKNDRSLAVCMQLFSELLQCRDDQFPQRVAMLERLQQAWKFDQLVPMTRASSSDADSDDAAFATDSPAGHYYSTEREIFFFCT